jgi:hypothetical protein
MYISLMIVTVYKVRIYTEPTCYSRKAIPINKLILTADPTVKLITVTYYNYTE